MSPAALVVAMALGLCAGRAHRRWPDARPGIVLIALGLALGLGVVAPWWLP